MHLDFGFPFAKRFIHMMDFEPRKGLKYLTRQIGSMFIARGGIDHFDPASGPPTCACPSCTRLLSTVWLLVGPPGGRGYRPGPWAGVLAYAPADVSALPELTGHIALGEPSGTGRCSVCGVSGPVYTAVSYHALPASNDAEKQTLYTSDRRRISSWQPDEMVAALCPEEYTRNGEAEWILAHCRQSHPIQARSGRCGPMSAAERERILAQDGLFRAALSRTAELRYIDPAEALRDPVSGWVIEAAMNYYAAGDGVAGAVALLRSYEPDLGSRRWPHYVEIVKRLIYREAIALASPEEDRELRDGRLTLNERARARVWAMFKMEEIADNACA